MSRCWECGRPAVGVCMGPHAGYDHEWSKRAGHVVVTGLEPARGEGTQRRRHGQNWTAIEERLLIRAAAEGLPLAVIAQLLGRTADAVRGHASAMRRRRGFVVERLQGLANSEAEAA